MNVHPDVQFPNDSWAMHVARSEVFHSSSDVSAECNSLPSHIAALPHLNTLASHHLETNGAHTMDMNSLVASYSVPYWISNGPYQSAHHAIYHTLLASPKTYRHPPGYMLPLLAPDSSQETVLHQTEATYARQLHQDTHQSTGDQHQSGQLHLVDAHGTQIQAMQDTEMYSAGASIPNFDITEPQMPEFEHIQQEDRQLSPVDVVPVHGPCSEPYLLDNPATAPHHDQFEPAPTYGGKFFQQEPQQMDRTELDGNEDEQQRGFPVLPSFPTHSIWPLLDRRVPGDVEEAANAPRSPRSMTSVQQARRGTHEGEEILPITTTSPAGGYTSSDSGDASPMSHENLKAKTRQKKIEVPWTKRIISQHPVHFMPSDPDDIKSREKRRVYIEVLERYIVELNKKLLLLGIPLPQMQKPDLESYKGISPRSIRAVLVHAERSATYWETQQEQYEQKLAVMTKTMHGIISRP